MKGQLIMSLADLQNKLVADLAKVVAFNSAVEAQINKIEASKTQLLTDMQQLEQTVQAAGIPVPMVISTALAEASNMQPTITALGPKLDAILESQNKVLNDVSSIIAPATAAAPAASAPAAPAVAPVANAAKPD